MQDAAARREAYYRKSAPIGIHTSAGARRAGFRPRRDKSAPASGSKNAIFGGGFEEIRKMGRGDPNRDSYVGRRKKGRRQ